MANKNEVNIKINAESENAVKGIDKVTKKLNSFSNSIKKNPITKLTDSFNIYTKAVGTVSSVVSKVTDAINECSDAYQTQLKAETQLETAAKNNPYLNDYSVSKLKAFASELQSISAVGDETLLPMMAELASAGRTQAEIQDIMSAALDASASGAISLDSAVKALNASYSGNAGQLGRVLPAVKNLTTEELKNGEAVKLVKQSYNGMAESVTNATGGWTKFQNSLGDFKEALGQTVSSVKNNAGKILSNVFDTITNAIKGSKTATEDFKEQLDILATLRDDAAGVSQLENALAQLQERQERLSNMKTVAFDLKGAETYRNELKAAYEEELGKVNALSSKYWNEYQKYLSQSQRMNPSDEGYDEVIEKMNEYYYKANNVDRTALNEKKKVFENSTAEIKALQKEFNDVYGNSKNVVENELKKVNAQIEQAQAQLKKAKKTESDTSSAKEQADALSALNDKALKAQAEYSKTVAAAKEEIAYRRSAGEEISQEAEDQELLNVKLNAYIQARKEAGSSMSDNNPWVKSAIADIETLTKKIEEAQKKADRNGAYFKIIDENDTKSAVDEMDKMIESFQEMHIAIRAEMVASGKDIAEFDEKYSETLEKLYEKKAQLQEESAAKTIENEKSTWDKVLEIASEFINTYAQAMTSISSMMTQNAQSNATIATAALEEQYAAGEVSTEEYYDKLEKIEKEQAEAEYKAQMWQWSASLLQIGVNTAQGISKALAEHGTYGIAFASAIGALGAIQTAAAIANKPIPPQYATGGIVPGTSYSGDKVQANVNSGEMILNTRQQAALWAAANGNGTSQSGGLNVSVKNYNAAETTTSQSLTADGLEIIVQKIVNKGLNNGTFNSGLTVAQNSMNGTLYSN